MFAIANNAIAWTLEMKLSQESPDRPLNAIFPIKSMSFFQNYSSVKFSITYSLFVVSFIQFRKQHV